MKRPTLATGSLALLSVIVTGLVWLITAHQSTAVYTGFVSTIVATLLQNTVISAQAKDNAETVKKVEQQTNGTLTKKLDDTAQDIKTHTTAVVKHNVEPTPNQDVVTLPVGSRVYDFSFGRPSPLVLKHDGRGDIRYLSGIQGKDLTRAEALAQFKDGVPVVALIFETTATRANLGFLAGQADARRALREAQTLGYPVSMPLYFANDQPTVNNSVKAYYRGVVSVLGTRAGAYGGYGLIALRLTHWLWQTSAWSGQAIHPAAHLYQRQIETHPIAGTDENVVMRPHPAWLPRHYRA